MDLAAVQEKKLLNISFIRLMNNAIRAESGDYDQLIKLENQAAKMMNDPAIAEKSLLSFTSVFAMLVLAITSVIALVKALKGKARSADAA